MKKRLIGEILTIVLVLISVSFISAACTDTDNGRNFAVKGIVNYNNQSFNDYCYVYKNVTYNYLIEYFCTGSSYSNYWYTCSNGCSNGACKVYNNSICKNQCSTGQKKCSGNYVYSCSDINYDGCLEWTYSNYCYAGCSNGVCNNAPCTDTDGGINYNLKGSIKFGNNTVTTDFCSNRYLYEYYCKNSSTYSYNYTICPINCLNGACSNQPPSCSETDSGYDPYNIGVTTFKNISYKDVCINSKLLTEYYCSNDNRYAYNTSCYYGCSNGACLTSTPSNQTCTDSDGGLNYYVNGIAKSSDGSFASDLCDVNGISLYEGYCKADGSARSVSYNCTNGCSNGVCKNQTQTTCTDSDGGKNYLVKGTTSGYYNGVFTTSDDVCSVDNKTLKELYCNGTSIVSQYYVCPSGCSNGACINQTCIPKTCSQLGKNCGSWSNGCGGTINCGNCASGQTCNATGQCVVALTCTDSDGGKNYLVKGTTSGYYNGVFTTSDDVCSVDNKTLKELYCNGSQMAQADYYTCPNNCLNGACLTVPPSNQTTAYLLKVMTIYNSSSSTASDDRVEFINVGTGDTISATITFEGQGTVNVAGKTYQVIYNFPSTISDEERYIQLIDSSGNYVSGFRIYKNGYALIINSGQLPSINPLSGIINWFRKLFSFS